MVDQKIEKENKTESTHAVESALTALWEKAREASYLISTLRDDKKKLLTKIDELEEDLQNVKNEVHMKQSQIEKINIEMSSKLRIESAGIDDNEKRLLQQKIRNILTTLDQYLSP